MIFIYLPDVRASMKPYCEQSTSAACRSVSTILLYLDREGAITFFSLHHLSHFFQVMNFLFIHTYTVYLARLAPVWSWMDWILYRRELYNSLIPVQSLERISFRDYSAILKKLKKFGSKL